MKLLLIIFTFFSTCVFAQHNFIDVRDSVLYETFTVENHVWLKSNLKYKTPSSWCYTHPESPACNSGNFYYAADLINVCPSGWRVPTWIEYKKAFKFIENNTSRTDSVTYTENVMPYKKHRILAEHVIGITLLGDSTFFDMTATGWIQGETWEPQQETTMWIVEEISTTPQPHVHILKNQVIKHAHEHHVWDKPKNVRRFSIRCISDIN